MSRLIDLTGQRFGKRIVLRKEGLSSSGRTLWLCRCDCGDHALVIGNNLRSGSGRSCKKCVSSKHIPLVEGQRFSKWTVVGRSNNDQKGFICWLCRCECGNTATIRHSTLVRGQSKSCRRCADAKAGLTRSTHGYSRNESIKKYGKLGYNRFRYYGVTPVHFQKMLDEQHGVCAICGFEFNSPGEMHLDHCHLTKLFRGILCGMCNHGLGSFRDKPKLLRNAAQYLELAHGK